METSCTANLQLIYVSSIERSTRFYETLFNKKPSFSSPRYVAFSAGGEALFAIWSGGTLPDKSSPRYSEVGIMMHSNEEVDALFQEWQTRVEMEVVQEPYTDVFGRTFTIKDPDGHLIRVCVMD